jgi:hypothetical protein
LDDAPVGAIHAVLAAAPCGEDAHERTRRRKGDDATARNDPKRSSFGSDLPALNALAAWSGRLFSRKSAAIFAPSLLFA